MTKPVIHSEPIYLQIEKQSYEQKIPEKQPRISSRKEEKNIKIQEDIRENYREKSLQI